MASEYRSQNETRTTHSNNVNEFKKPPQPSYATVAQCTPNKEQAIVIEAQDGIPIKEYVLTIGKLIDPVNIHYVSRISNSRVCMFLSSKSIAQELCLTHPTVTIDDKILALRPLITSNKRVILSNVCPIIPNAVIEEELLDLGITPKSSISYIKAGFPIKGFSHILSFRRQLYIKPEDFSLLPEALQLTYDGTTYWIYVTSDVPTCFLCKAEGHIARQCTSGNSTFVADPQNMQTPQVNNDANFPELNKRTNADTDKENTLSNNETKDTNSLNLNPVENNHSDDLENPIELKKPENPTIATARTKRPLTSEESTANSSKAWSDVSSNTQEDNSEDEVHLVDTKSTNKLKQPRKKPKRTESSQPIEELLQPVKGVMESSPADYVLDFVQLKSFFENTWGATDILHVAKDYTNNIERLIETLRKLYPHYKDRSIKNRSSRIEKKLLAAIVNQKESDTEDLQK